MNIRFLAVAVSVLLALTSASARQASNQQQPSDRQQSSTPAKSAEAMCPMHNSHTSSGGPSSGMNERGEQGMGFSQTVTTHHFLLRPDGGVIQVGVKEPANTADRDRVRMHLRHIAQAFSQGDFAIPMFVHDTVPPGVQDMKRLRQKIRYSFEETPAGGRVLIATNDPESVAAIHKFLRFQIEEHKTGDATEVR